jgi:hypothetical protein
MKEHLTEKQSLELYMKHTAFGNREMEELRFHAAVNEAVQRKAAMLRQAVAIIKDYPHFLGDKGFGQRVDDFLNEYGKEENR